jgi:hypothetical protein
LGAGKDVMRVVVSDGSHGGHKDHTRCDLREYFERRSPSNCVIENL